MSKKLILGSAGKEHADAVTLDIDPEHHPDVLHDLNKTPYPFDDNQFDKIIAHHVLEHLNDLPPVMEELHRICSPQGKIEIEVPHHSSWMANTPEHKLRFNYFAFAGYAVEPGVKDWVTGSTFKLLKREITFHRRFRRFLLHKIFNRNAKNYERFWTYIFPAEHFKVTLQPIK